MDMRSMRDRFRFDGISGSSADVAKMSVLLWRPAGSYTERAAEPLLNWQNIKSLTHGMNNMTDVNLQSQKAAPKGYWIVLASVLDMARFGTYTAVAGPLLASFGGRVLARGNVMMVAEGSAAGRPYLVEFPSYEVAQACFNSAGYQEAIKLRDGIAKFDILITEGFVPEA
jgi:uncharacterized protein (DUF1330 family)